MNPNPTQQKSGQLVLPGERLGVIEEFSPDTGTFVENGVIFAMIVGHALRDLTTRRVSVYPVSQGLKMPLVGDTVTGQVMGGQSDNANVRIFQIGDRQLQGELSGVLHISDVHIRYVDSMYNVAKTGDVITARVVSDKNHTYHLSTKDRDLGVIFAFCSRCGGFLEPRRQGMHCSQCGNLERRKTAFGYGKGLIK